MQRSRDFILFSLALALPDASFILPAHSFFFVSVLGFSIFSLVCAPTLLQCHNPSTRSMMFSVLHPTVVMLGRIAFLVWIICSVHRFTYLTFSHSNILSFNSMNQPDAKLGVRRQLVVDCSNLSQGRCKEDLENVCADSGR
ncbi:hypothetical protein BKA93DRAFT_392902 [Sparassis latifolia]